MAEFPKREPKGGRGAEAAGAMGKWAPYYDTIIALATAGRERRLRETTVNLARLLPGERVLEIGCGTGSLCLAARARVGPLGEVCGIDPAPEMIEAARKKGSRAGLDKMFQVGRIESIPFPDGYFDVVLCSFMVFVINDDTRRRGFSEVLRVLKPGGRVLVLDFSPPADTLLRHLVPLLFGRGHTLQRIRPMIEKAGFTETEIGETKYRVLSFLQARSPGQPPAFRPRRA
jgi:ubiquinone/menaquinone biosynthesis C-methylase UbiE